MSLVEHLEKLRHFVRVSQFNSIREASQTMGLSQAGLSKSISALEDVLETRLFIRSKEGLTLTKEGLQVLNASNKIVSEATDLEQRLRSQKNALAPKVFRIGMYDSIAVYFGSELSKYLKAIYPDVKLEITADSSSALVERINRRRLDLAIGVNYDQISTSELRFFKLFDDHYSFYVSPKNVKNLTDLSFLIHERATDSAGRSVENYLKSEIKRQGAHRVLNFETLKTLTLQGFGIGVLPTQVAKPLIKTSQLMSVQLSTKKHLFGVHNIGILATDKLLETYGSFTKDMYRLGESWSKT